MIGWNLQRSRGLHPVHAEGDYAPLAEGGPLQVRTNERR
jgi:hypothetical protein